MDVERSAVLGMVNLRKATGTSASFAQLCDEMCHPRLRIFCRKNKLDRPWLGVKPEILDGSHTASTIGDLYFGTRFLLRH